MDNADGGVTSQTYRTFPVVLFWFRNSLTRLPWRYKIPEPSCSASSLLHIGYPQGPHRQSEVALAEAAGLSERSVRRIWHKHGLKPHLSRT